MTAPVPARSWGHYGLLRRHLLISTTHPGDDAVEVSCGDGAVVYLSAEQVAELRNDLDARLAVMRPDTAGVVPEQVEAVDR